MQVKNNILKKTFLFSIIFMFLFLIAFNSESVYASPLEISKSHLKTIDTTENFDLILEVKNLENENIKIKIHDNLVFNDNGLNIECYEVNIPKNSTILIKYSDIYKFNFNSPGIYNLNMTKISYNFKNQKYEETINETKLEVIGQQQSSSQTINVYQCDNVRSINMQTFSSNNGNYKVNFNSGGININNYNPLQELEDSNNLSAKEKFRNNLIENQKILDIINQQIKEGYSFDNIDVNAINETTGVFNIIFKDINNQRKIISGSSDNLIINIKESYKRYTNKLILPIFLIFFLIWVLLSLIYLFFFRKKIKNDNIICLFKPKLKKDLIKYKNEDILICSNNEKCSVRDLLKEIKDLEEKSEIMTFIKNNKEYIKNDDYKKLIYKKLNKKEIEELKEIIIYSLKEYNEKV